MWLVHNFHNHSKFCRNLDIFQKHSSENNKTQVFRNLLEGSAIFFLILFLVFATVCPKELDTTMLTRIRILLQPRQNLYLLISVKTALANHWIWKFSSLIGRRHRTCFLGYPDSNILLFLQNLKINESDASFQFKNAKMGCCWKDFVELLLHHT